MVVAPWRSAIPPDRFKRNLSPRDQYELYDPGSDPYRRFNLFDEPSQRDRMRDMAARNRIWRAKTGDEMALPSV